MTSDISKIIDFHLLNVTASELWFTALSFISFEDYGLHLMDVHKWLPPDFKYMMWKRKASKKCYIW